MKYKPGVGAVMAWGGGLMNYSSQLNKRSSYVSCNIEVKCKYIHKGSFTYYVITKEEGGFGMITLM